MYFLCKSIKILANNSQLVFEKWPSDDTFLYEMYFASINGHRDRCLGFCFFVSLLIYNGLWELFDIPLELMSYPELLFYQFTHWK